MTITIDTADPRTLKALALLEGAGRWVKAHRKDSGQPFFVIPSSSNPGRVYWTDQVSCTCADAVHRGATCKHQLAVRLWNLRQKAGAPSPRRAAADELHDLSAEDLAQVLGPPPGSPERQLDPRRVAALSARYEDLFPSE